MVANNSALQLYDDIYKCPEIAQRIKNALELGALSQSLTGALTSLLTVQEKVSPQYFVSMGNRLLEKTRIYRQEILNKEKLRAKELEDAKELRDKITELGAQLQDCQVKTQAKILLTMFERFLAGQSSVKDPRGLNELVITPSEFLSEAAPLSQWMSYELISVRQRKQCEAAPLTQRMQYKEQPSKQKQAA